MANVAINNITDTWNSSGTTFTGIKFNVTDTASAGASLLMDLQVGVTSRFRVTKYGSVSLSLPTGLGAIPIIETNNYGLYYDPASVGAYISLNGISVISFYRNSTPQVIVSSLGIGASDTVLVRDAAANTLAQRNGVNAQTNRLYGTYTDASNYRRLTKTMSAAGVAEIKPEGGGTGATGNVLHISGLPTANPGPGILWNNAGVVNVGT